MTVQYSEFAGRHVLVTGAAAGIGKAVALAFAGQGAHVTAVDRAEVDLSTEPLKSGSISPITLDLVETGAIRTAFEQATEHRGPVTVLVNNAGVDRRISLEDQSPEVWREMMMLNLDHQAILSSLAAPGMTEAGGGAIVNMSSTAWMKLAGNLTAYHAAKSAIIGLTKGLARDLGAKNVRVNAIAPGRVVTERVNAKLTDAWIAETHQIQCLKDIITPEDIAQSVLWLSSSGARMITGQTLIVDGGVV